MAKKLKHEGELLKVALEMVMADAVRRGVVEFELTDSHDLTIECACRLLVHDEAISPLPDEQRTAPNKYPASACHVAQAPASSRPRIVEIVPCKRYQSNIFSWMGRCYASPRHVARRRPEPLFVDFAGQTPAPG